MQVNVDHLLENDPHVSCVCFYLSHTPETQLLPLSLTLGFHQ